MKEGNIVIDWVLAADPYFTGKKLEGLVDEGKVRRIRLSRWVHGHSALVWC